MPWARIRLFFDKADMKEDFHASAKNSSETLMSCLTNNSYSIFFNRYLK